MQYGQKLNIFPASWQSMNIGLEQESRETAAELLQKVLANQEVLYQKLRHFHWNIVGKDFFELHEVFEDLYTMLAEDIDEVAERIRSLGMYTKGTFAQFLQLAEIKEEPEYPEASVMVQQLLDDIETVIRNIRSTTEGVAKVNDSGSEDMLIGLMAKYEKKAWMLRSKA